MNSARRALLKKFVCLMTSFFIAVYPVVSYSMAIESGAALSNVMTFKNAAQVATVPVRLNPVGAAITGAILIVELVMWLNSGNEQLAQQIKSLNMGTVAAPDKYQFPVTTDTVPKSTEEGHSFTWTRYDGHVFTGVTLAEICGSIASGASVDPASCTNYGFTYSQNGDISTGLFTIPGVGNFNVLASPAGDGKYSFQKATNGYVPDPNDPDWNTTEGQQRKASIPATGAPISITGVDANGVPNTVTLAPTSSSPGINIRGQYQSADAQGNSQVVTQEATFAPGSVNSTSQTTTQGSINTNPAPGQNPVTNPNLQDIKFPDDYAREGTQLQVAASLRSIDGWLNNIDLNTSDTVSKLSTTNSRLSTLNTSVNGVKTAVDGLHADLTAQGTPNPDPGTRTNNELKAGFFGTAFDALKGWRLPAHSSQCPTSSFAWNGNVYTFDAHCQLIQDHFAAFQSVMQVVFALSALFIVLRA